MRDEVPFARYIRRELMPKELPRMADGARRNFERSIQEMFNNAVAHSHSKFGVFSCGQHFPHKSRIDFAVTDLGIGFRANVERKTGHDWTAADAIQWATQEDHTTRTGLVPGGIGLKLLCQFIGRNEGRVQIVSENGYWELYQGREERHQLHDRFPGSVVNIQIDTDDETFHEEFGTAPAPASGVSALADSSIF